MGILGIDVGGSGIKGAIVDMQTGELMSPRIRIKTPERSTPKAIGNGIQRIIRQLEYDGEIFGSGFPGVVLHGVCKTAANIDSSWIDTNIPEVYEEITGIHNYALNDADAAALAEAKYGAAQGVDGVILILTLGTGIGSAIINDGVLLPNLEFGHLQIRDKEAEKRASAGVKAKKKLNWTDWAAALDEYLHIMENLFWPDLIIVGGGISRNSALFFPHLTIRTQIVPAKFLNQAGIIGSAIYANECHSLKAS